jgi:hypothetical protein
MALAEADEQALVDATLQRAPLKGHLARSTCTGARLEGGWLPAADRSLDADARHHQLVPRASPASPAASLTHGFGPASRPVPQLSRQQFGDLFAPRLGPLNLPFEQRSRHILHIEALGTGERCVAALASDLRRRPSRRTR